ncbi:hypothetical protein HQ48_04470 [Porphyromonas sp. COT-290 OH3588]|nr:hypothetical protein HQ48_04470 [Porphyromonas sp. COT-290 OH3588]
MMSYKILINNITSVNIQIDYTDYRDNEFIFSRTNVNIYLFLYQIYFSFPATQFSSASILQGTPLPMLNKKLRDSTMLALGV